MTVEAATYIDTLDPALPASADFVYEGDDHMRLIKSVLQATFPNIDAPVTATPAGLNAAGQARDGSWFLQKEVAVTGTPSTIDFVHGSGGVVLDDGTFEHELVFVGVSHSANAALNLALSINAGSTWTALGSSIIGQQLFAAGATPTAATMSLSSTLSLTGAYTIASTRATEGVVCIMQSKGALRAIVQSRLWFASVGTHFVDAGATDGALANSINGIRLSWSTGTFTAGGVIRLFSRKAP
ncbi:MAG TPA: hypothetical protein PKO45_13045 [Rubrivivax sp.]|nr:hypothetical protein [Rubrivivax sp.]